MNSLPPIKQVTSPTPTRLFLLATTFLSHFASAAPASIYFNQLSQEYNGTPKFPNISTDPPGLSLNISITPRSQSEVVFSTLPVVPEPSYQSYGIDGTTNKALGDEVVLGGSNRFLESIEISMVNFSGRQTGRSWRARTLSATSIP